MIRSRLICLAACCGMVCQALAQGIADRSSITAGVGGETTLGSYFSRTGPAFHGLYEFRVGKYLSLTAGALTAGDETWMPGGTDIRPVAVLSLPAGTNLFMLTGTNQLAGFIFVPVPTRRLSTAVHSTVRGILPTAHGRFELFLGAGPGYAWNFQQSPAPNGFVFDFEAGGRFSIDKGRRFWIGAGSQFFGNFSRDRQQWLAATADLTFRFGRR